jgi:hypothetical protein
MGFSMKRMLICSVLAVGIAGAFGCGVQALAADVAGDSGPAMSPGAPPPPPWAGGWGPGEKHHGGPPGMGPDGWGHEARDFGLFAPAADKNLTPADVKVIATAILLEHGKHDWTVTGVAAAADKTIHFSYATAHGDVVATFAIDPVTGRVTRVG